MNNEVSVKTIRGPGVQTLTALLHAVNQGDIKAAQRELKNFALELGRDELVVIGALVAPGRVDHVLHCEMQKLATPPIKEY